MYNSTQMIETQALIFILFDFMNLNMRCSYVYVFSLFFARHSKVSVFSVL